MINVKFYAKAILMVTLITISTQTQGQTAIKDCGCAYKPLCNYDMTKSYAGKVYKGIRNDDESISYYHCENGILTAKWTWKRYNDFTDENEYFNYTRILLKESAKPGEVWTEHGPDGRYYDRFIVKKHASFTVNGQVYKDVIQVRQLDKHYPWKTEKEIVDYYENLGSSIEYFKFGWEALYVTDFYYARGQGQVFSNKITKEFIKELRAKFYGPAKEYNINLPADIREYLAAHDWIEPWSMNKGGAVNFTKTNLWLGTENLGSYDIKGTNILVNGEVIFHIITTGLNEGYLLNLKIKDRPNIILEPVKRKTQPVK